MWHSILHESCWAFSSATTNPACSIPGRCCSRAFTQFSMLLKQHKKPPTHFNSNRWLFSSVFQQHFVHIRACLSVKMTKTFWSKGVFIKKKKSMTNTFYLYKTTENKNNNWERCRLDFITDQFWRCFVHQFWMSCHLKLSWNK